MTERQQERERERERERDETEKGWRRGHPLLVLQGRSLPPRKFLHQVADDEKARSVKAMSTVNT